MTVAERIALAQEILDRKHIANATIMKELTAIVTACGHEMPFIRTPEELLGA